MKKALSIFLAVLMVITALPLTAITSFATTSGDFEYEVILKEDKTCEITNYTGTATELTIPSTLDGYSVTSIGDEAFYQCTSLKNITIPDSVTSIGDDAFYHCTALESITIPDSVTSIGGWAFCGCTALEIITIPNSVTSIGHNAFYDTAYCNDETNWENDVLYIGNNLIHAKETISGDYAVKDGTKTIADGAFNDCTSLANI